MLGSNSASPMRILGQSGVGTAPGAVTTEFTAATIAIPVLGPNDAIHVIGDFSGLSGSGTKTCRAYLGGTLMWSSSMAASITGVRTDLLIANRGATNSQRWSSNHLNSTPASALQNGAIAVETNAGTTLTITLQKSVAGDTATLESYRVMLTKG